MLSLLRCLPVLEGKTRASGAEASVRSQCAPTQETAKDRLQDNLAQARLRLGHRDPNAPGSEIYISPAKRRQLVSA